MPRGPNVEFNILVLLIVCCLCLFFCACLLALLVVIRLVVSYMEMCTLLYYMLPRQIQVDDCLSKGHLRFKRRV